MNINKLMKQAACMQKNMAKVQADLAEKTFAFSSGGGMVTAVFRGDMTLASIKIDPKVVDPDDVEMLEDLVKAAVEGAMKQAQEMSAQEMDKVTSGMGLPPGMMPF